MKQGILTVDPARRMGDVKPLNGVGGGPVTGGFGYDATRLFREAHIPLSRTHDIEYPFGAGEYIDIHNLFPDFEKDENDPRSYNFVLTDEYMKCIDSAGAKALYRLGSSIEHQPVKRYIHPPRDAAKWARVCSRIISHYNDGWADGFRFGIRYWEIWNEPDFHANWTGTPEQILDLYAVTASIIRHDHPDVKIGGLGFADPRGKLVDDLLRRCRDAAIPLDFVSWHLYVSRPEQVSDCAGYIRRKLDAYGFSSCESIYDEWNYVYDWNGGIAHSFAFHRTVAEAAFMASVMTTAQACGIDAACYYDAQVSFGSAWNGLLTPGPRYHPGLPEHTVLPLPGYYALKYWGALLGGTVVSSCCDCPGIYATAAISGDGTELRLLLSHFEDAAGYGMCPPDVASIRLETGDFPDTRVEARVTDAFGTDVPMPVSDGTVTLRGYAAALVTLRRP